jgi:hypothetical protein
MEVVPRIYGTSMTLSLLSARMEVTITRFLLTSSLYRASIFYQPAACRHYDYAEQRMKIFA